VTPFDQEASSMNRTNSPVGTMANAAQRASIGGPAAMTASTYFLKVGGETCEVRIASLHSIPEVLGFEDEMQMAFSAVAGGESQDAGTDDPQAIADLLESRMIAPPRPRRRRERAVSSRAVFFGASGR
jgi:hypothetical protein